MTSFRAIKMDVEMSYKILIEYQRAFMTFSTIDYDDKKKQK